MSHRKPNITAEEFASAFVGELAEKYPPILSPKQLAELLGKSVKTIYEWLGRDRLEVHFENAANTY